MRLVARILSTFDTELFLPHEKWEALAWILQEGGGGSYGLSGSRGAGKTWMMERANAWAESKGGLGVWFPSPSEYEPTAFLAALSDVTATRFERYYDKKTGRTIRLARRQFVLRASAAYIVLIIAAAVILAGSGNHQLTAFINSYTVAGFLLAGAAGVLVGTALRQLQRSREGLGRVLVAAGELRQQIRYLVTTRESAEVAATAKHAGIGGMLKRASERQLVERPATLSSLIHNFRAFVGDMASAVECPVVIAVDELDKMSDPTKVADLLRDIKGIFEIPGVYFLVSISDEAARSLELGAVRTRNEFNSSFYTVLSLAQLDARQAVELLRLRAGRFDERLAISAGILAGGIPREIVRIASLYDGIDDPSSLGQNVVGAIGEETAAFLGDVLSAPTNGAMEESRLTQEDKLALWQVIATEQSKDSATFSRFALGLLRAWDINETSPGWRRLYQEQWRRLTIRIVVAGLLVARPERMQGPATSELQEIVKTGAASAVVARAELAKHIVREMGNRAGEVHELDEDEVALSLFLVARDSVPFTERDCPVGSGAQNGAIGAFRRYGILKPTHSGLGTSWILSEAARRALGT